MIRQPIVSSNIKSIGYDDITNVLEIEYITGDVYEYQNVPDTVYRQVMATPSKGTAVHKLIKGKYSYKLKGK